MRRDTVILHLLSLCVSFLAYRVHQSLPLSWFISPPGLMINWDLLSSLCALTFFMSYPTMSLKEKLKIKNLLTHLHITPNPHVAYFMQKWGVSKIILLWTKHPCIFLMFSFYFDLVIFCQNIITLSSCEMWVYSSDFSAHLFLPVVHKLTFIFGCSAHISKSN